jgi:hypothetical protein
MEFTVFEAQVIREFAEAYIAEFKNAIQTKQVPRIGKSGSFSSTTNASGKLANSGEWYFDGAKLNIYVNYYLYWLVFGRKDNRKRPPIFAIEEWMQEKGITGVSPFAIANSIAKNGSTIYQKFQGLQSNLLEDIRLDELLKDLGDKLGDDAVGLITTEFVKNFDNIEDLNIEI